ncbi:cytochrome c [Sorangium sp. So ce131]|uniref:c-type cytochrome n=1 Tax=Sorangium sp. So ce131 TaxID=3133282 RepID=UPI003F615125
MRKINRKAVRRVLGGILLLGGITGFFVWYKFFRDVRVNYADDDENFKYGSIANEGNTGIPYLIWKALPELCPQHLPGPGGYASLGMVYEGREAPIGISVRTIGFPRAAINCAFCHVSTVRDEQGGAPHILLGATSGQLDVQGYTRFLWACAGDPRFTPDGVVEAIRRTEQLSWVDEQLYRHLIIPQTRKALLQQRDQWMTWLDAYLPSVGHRRPRWGRGRIEPFNPVKFHMLRLPIDETIGVADMQPIWEMTPSVQGNYSYHWDGLNDSLREVADSSALGDGTTLRSFESDQIRRIERWMTRAAAPQYPYAVNRALADEGRRVYVSAGCAECHDVGGTRYRTVIPVDEKELRTDRFRVQMWTPEAADAYNRYAEGTKLDFNRFRSTTGYLSTPLHGLWATGPYLHNGSVPTLWHLLTPAERPQVFYRGLDVVDRKRGGFVHDAPDAPELARKGLLFRYDTREPGNGNQGHTYGAGLSRDDKMALIEYLKTL